MALKIIIRPLAEEDLDDAICWYNKKKEILGEEFLLEFVETLKIVSLHPLVFRKRYKQARAFGVKYHRQRRWLGGVAHRATVPIQFV